MTRMSLQHKALQRLIDSLTVDLISEPLQSIVSTEKALKALSVMRERHFDILGVFDANNKVIGYLNKDELKEGRVVDFCRDFNIEEIISFKDSLEDRLLDIYKKGRLFVLGRNGIENVVTAADLQKIPVRIMLFGVVSLLEMDILEWIRAEYQHEKWKEVLREERIKKAEELYEERRRINQEIDLADCLQLCDKADVLINNDKARSILHFNSKNDAKEFFRELRKLRDNLAHAQDPTKAMEWPQIAELTRKAKDMSKLLLPLVEEQSSKESS